MHILQGKHVTLTESILPSRQYQNRYHVYQIPRKYFKFSHQDMLRRQPVNLLLQSYYNLLYLCNWTSFQLALPEYLSAD